jgi:SH3-like domain-containing protein
LRTLTALSALLFVTLAAHAAPGPAPRPKPVLEAALHVKTPVPPPIVATGLPVPRWVTVKAERVNVRRGPSREHDVLWTYVKPGTPVEVIAEYDSWRRIRDADGGTGWVTAALLDGRRNVVVTGRVNTAILGRPKADAEAIAFAQPGVVAKLVACKGEWCEISTRGYDGYVARDRLWGVYEGETVR